MKRNRRTRAEILEDQIKKIEDQKTALQARKSQLQWKRVMERKKKEKARQAQVGEIAAEFGLAEWSDDQLRDAFADLERQHPERSEAFRKAKRVSEPSGPQALGNGAVTTPAAGHSAYPHTSL